jgi:ribose transport system ATP-binding protein
MAVVLEAKHIVKNFYGVSALSDGNLVCKEGKITGLLGANGSGKSTISKCITGVYHKNGGTITYLGKEVDFKNPMAAKAAGIAMAFQNLSLLPDLKVWQNIVMCFEEKKGRFLDDGAAKEKAKKILDEFVPGFDINRYVSELTPSELQIVEIAKSISQDPKLLFLDEPTAALEQTQVKALFNYMRRLASRGVSIVFTSHRMPEVMEICDDVTVFSNGKVVGSLDFETDGRDSDKIVQMITGVEKTVFADREYKPIADENMLIVKNLNYGKKLRNINLNVRKGEVLGVGGLSGQGQEELLMAIAGNYADINMESTLDGKPIKLTSPARAIREGIVLIPGDRQLQGLMSEKTIYENSILPKIGLDREPNVIPRKKYLADVLEEKKLLSLKSDGVFCPVSTLSGGNAQKVVMGKWVHVAKKVMLLSDPAKGVDVGAKKDMYDFVQKLVDEEGLSVILYASDNDELIRNCDRVIMMHDGKIVAELVGKEITDEALVSISLTGKKAEEKEEKANE